MTPYPERPAQTKAPRGAPTTGPTSGRLSGACGSVPRRLAFTRYCFTSKLYCVSQSSFHCPQPPANPTLLQYCCTTIAQYTPHHRPPPLYATHHTISVMAISCKGQPADVGELYQIYVYSAVK